MNEKKVKEYIENIEQLGADARFYFNNEKYDRLIVELESILYWSKKAIKEVKKKEN